MLSEFLAGHVDRSLLNGLLRQCRVFVNLWSWMNGLAKFLAVSLQCARARERKPLGPPSDGMRRGVNGAGPPVAGLILKVDSDEAGGGRSCDDRCRWSDE